MKTTTMTIGALTLMAHLAAAQPFRRHPHFNKHVKKDVVVTVFAEPTEVPQVIVYVDQLGVPVSTTTEGVLAAPAPSPAPVVENVAAAPEAVAAAPSPAEVVAPVATPVYSPTAEPASTPSAGGYGFSYSPYNPDGSCKSQDQVDVDFKTIGSTFSLVRTYGTDCNQVATVLKNAKAYGMKMFAGIYDLEQEKLPAQVKTIVDAANGDWSLFDTVSVGNEAVNAGRASPATVIAAIGTVRGLLKAAKYTGKVVTVDTLVAMRANPGLCDASDYCAANCHPFFDGQVTADKAGDFLTDQIPTLRAVLANKDQDIVISETGWPSKGNPNGAAVPSSSNQAAAISSIKSKFTSDPTKVILFTAFNDMWKKSEASTFFAEQFWGFKGDAPSN